MLNKKKIIVAIAGLATATVSFADFTTQNNWVVNVEGGYSALFTPDTALSAGSNASHSNSSWSMSAGLGREWLMADNLFLGLEGDYFYNGDATYKGTGAPNDTGSLEIDSSALAALITSRYYFGSNVNIFAKFGVAYLMGDNKASSTVTITGAGGNNYLYSGSNTINNWEPMGVIGAGYTIPVTDTSGLDIYADVVWVNGDNKGNFGYISGNNAAINPGSFQERLGLAYIF